MNIYERELKEMELSGKEKVIFSIVILIILAIGIGYWTLKSGNKVITPDYTKVNTLEIITFPSEAFDMIKRHEGIRNKVYLDTENNPTIGVGFNLNRKDAKQKIESLGANYDDILNGKESLNNNQIETLFRQDLFVAVNDAKSFLPNFDTQPKEIKMVIVNMAFNLGYTRLNKFEKFRQALMDRDYNKATKEMVDSKWYNQVGNRSKELVKIVKNI